MNRNGNKIEGITPVKYRDIQMEREEGKVYRWGEQER
jgi:hypothetical protein